MSLKWRVTLVTALLIAISSSLIGVASYVSISQTQLNAIDVNLSNTLGVTQPRALERRLIRGRQSPNFFSTVAIAVVTDNGELSIIQPSGSIDEPDPFPLLPPSAINTGINQAQTFSDSETGKDFRIISRSTGRGLNVVALTSLDTYSSTMRQILVLIMTFVIAVTFAGAILSWLVVRAFFRPVDSMIAAAGAISQGDVSVRVPEAGQGTELGDLAEALNSMLHTLQQSLSTTQESEEALRNFVSDASHEIRTPLTVIRGYSEILLAQSQADGTDLRALQRIDAEAKRLERLVTSLLALERTSHEKTRKHVQLDEVVSTHIEDLVVMSPRPASLTVDSVVIIGDRDSWEQVMGNITQNIMRYTPPHSPVSVQLRKTTDGFTESAELTIDDSGPGIPSDLRERLFDRFARLDDSRSSETGGFGLGMSIVKATVDAHGGHIYLDESPNGGLRITISVPLA